MEIFHIFAWFNDLCVKVRNNQYCAMMDINEYYEKLTAITGDGCKPVLSRIDDALTLKEAAKPDDDVAAARFDSLTYQVLASMLDKENADHDYDVEMLQVLTLGAEAMVAGHLERSLKDYRLLVDTLIDECIVPFDMLQFTVGRIVAALRKTVYNHDRYGILDAFIRRAAKVVDQGEEVDREAVADMARELYRLDNLLSVHGADDEAILKFITEDELLEIRENPQEGYLKKDPIEYSRRWESVYYDVKDELDERFADTPRGMGFCFEYWHAMADLLAKKYRILWRNPHLMNPDVIFD